MTLCKRLAIWLLPVPLVFCPVVPVLAAPYFVAQKAQGRGDGSSPSNAGAITGSHFTTAANWQPGAQFVLVGIITTPWQILGSGSTAHPLTVLWNTNAMMSAPVWTGFGTAFCAIFGTGLHDVILDGGFNGAIAATQSGDGLSNTSGCNGIFLVDCSRVTIKNLAVSNLYVRTAATNESAAGEGISFVGGENANAAPNVSGDSIVNCNLHDMWQAIGLLYGSNWSNLSVSGCTISNVNWGIRVGDQNASSRLDGLTITSNYIHGFGNWDDAQNRYHHDGLIVYADAGIATHILTAANHFGPGYGGGTSAAAYVNQNIYVAVSYGDIFDCTDGTSPNDGMLFMFSTAAKSQMLVVNDLFIGSHNGTGLEWGKGYSPGTTSYAFANNIFLNINTAIYAEDATTYTMAGDYNLYYGVPLTGNGFSWSSTTSAAFLDYTNTDGYGCAFRGWRNCGFDTHGTTGNPNLDAVYVPRAPSAAIGGGKNLKANLAALGVSTVDAQNKPRQSLPAAWDIGPFKPTSP